MLRLGPGHPAFRPGRHLQGKRSRPWAGRLEEQVCPAVGIPKVDWMATPGRFIQPVTARAKAAEAITGWGVGSENHQVHLGARAALLVMAHIDGQFRAA